MKALLALACLIACSAAQAATTDLPNPTVLQVIGSQCGVPVPPTMTAIGFSQDANYFTAQAYATTRCSSGSGRGGGYTSHTYTGCALVRWDLSGNLVDVTRGACQSIVVTPGQVFSNGSCSSYTAQQVGNVIELLTP